MPVVKTKGAASSQGFGEFAKTGVANYIEDVFSAYLYTGTASAQTITNGIDLAGKGGIVWTKSRNSAGSNYINSTVNVGASTYVLKTESTAAQGNESSSISSWNSDGFTGWPGWSGINLVSWTFRKQPKFFDVVTYTGDGTQYFPGRYINHNLGSVPGCIIFKNLSRNTDWHVEHISLDQWIPNAYSQCLALNSTSAQSPSAFGYGCLPIATSTTFNVVGTGDAELFPVNYAGDQYVAYLFAHNAGGFGLSGTDNVISCGSYTGNGTIGAGPVVTLGYEPQWLLIKSTGTSGWFLVDNMRGTTSSGSNVLLPYLSAAELVNDPVYGVQLLPTGFQPTPSSNNSNINVSGQTYIYIAIRRGPMKVPTDATTVYQATTYSGSNTNNRSISTNFPVDMFFDLRRNGVQDKYALDRLRGNERLWTNLTTAGSANTAQVPTNSFNANQTGILVSADELNTSTRTYVLEAFRRAPGFFDEVCYTGTGSATTFNHNLGVAPELMIVKDRSSITNWFVYSSSLGATKYLNLNQTSAQATATAAWNDTTPTASVFTVGTSGSTNSAADKYVAYLFASCSGVSKVGSYTGNGSTQTINCGFTGGARFVLIKRTDAVGDWYVYDTARGMTSLTDPYLLINSDAAETATLGSVTTVTTGFAVDAAILAAINTNTATYIYLAIS